MDASLQRSMSIRHCLGQWCASSVYENQVFWMPRSNVAEPFVRATWRFAPHCSTTFVSLPAIINAMVYSPAFTFSSIYPLGFCRVPGCAFGRCASFKIFWPLAPVLLALAASVFVALCVCAAFSVWPLRLTGQSSRFAFGERLTFVR